MPQWARAINQALDHAAPMNACLEFLGPATSRGIMPMLRNPEKYAKYSPIITGAIIPLAALAIDTTALIGIMYLGHNPAEIAGLKLAANAATHMTIDLLGTTIQRVRYFKPPCATFVV